MSSYQCRAYLFSTSAVAPNIFNPRSTLPFSHCARRPKSDNSLQFTANQRRHTSGYFSNCCSFRLPPLRNTSSISPSERRPINDARRLYPRATACTNSDADFFVNARRHSRERRCERAWQAPAATAAACSAGFIQSTAVVGASLMGP